MLKQKMKQTLTTAAAAGALSLSVGMGSAQAINVGGVIFTPGVHMEVASIFENVVTANGDILSGYGEVSGINGKNAIEGDGTGFCQSGCELTYEFGGFVTQNLNVPMNNVEFSAGWINFYVDAAPDFDASLVSAANRIAASNGTLWLTLAGHNNLVGGNIGTVFGSGANLGTGNDIGNGGGIMDVDLTGLANGNTAGAGALANVIFDTNVVPDNLMGFGDFDFTSSFSNIGLPLALQAECAMGGFLNPAVTCLTGAASLEGFAVAQVPEPTALGLMGLGLITLGSLRRRRKKTA